MTTRTYDYNDGPVTASFTEPGTVAPEEAVAVLADALAAIGGELVCDFDPAMQPRKADEGYVSADIRVQFPDGRRVWLNVECPTDDAT